MLALGNGVGPDGSCKEAGSACDLYSTLLFVSSCNAISRQLPLISNAFLDRNVILNIVASSTSK